MVEDNMMLEAATGPTLRVRSALCQELAGLEKLVRQMASKDPAYLRLMTFKALLASHGPPQAILPSCLPEDPARTWLPGINEQNQELL